MRKGIYRYKKDERAAYLLLILLVAFLLLIPKPSANLTKDFSPVTKAQLYDVIKKNHPNPKLVVAMIEVESRWNSKAISSKGAIGLGQVMPSTAKWLTGYTREDLFCPVKNIIAACQILKHYQRTSPNLKVALAKYSGNANRYYERVMEEM